MMKNEPNVIAITSSSEIGGLLLMPFTSPTSTHPTSEARLEQPIHVASKRAAQDFIFAISVAYFKSVITYESVTL
jgi:hypothetical protein